MCGGKAAMSPDFYLRDSDKRPGDDVEGGALLLLIGFRPGFGRNERLTVIDQHNRAHGQLPAHLNRRRVGNAYAAMTGR